MSQSGSGGVNDSQEQNQAGQTTENQQTTCQNGRVEPPADNAKQDLSNGFENRTVDYDKRFAQDKHQQNQTTGPNQEQHQQQTGQYPAGRRQSMVGLPEDRHPPTGQLPPQQYIQDKSGVDRTQHVSQTSTQTLPVQAHPQFMPDYDQAQYTQIRNQFEVRPQMYPQQTQYAERAGYVTRDVTYRDSALYQGGAANPVFTGQGQYVTVQHGSQIPSQSASPQPPYFSGVVVPQPPGYAQFGSQPQYSYSQYPQTVMNAVPYTHHGGIYPGQQFGQQSPNPQRFTQELGQYQTQPIIQPIAQNVAHGIPMATTDRPSRGPKPMVPPRGSSKITHDTGHRKSASVDVPGIQKPKYDPNQNPPQEQIHRSDGAIIVQGTPIITDSQDRRYLSAINQTPRTRQDGLYVDTNGDPPGRDKMCETIVDCGLYVARPEHRKSISVDVTSSFQRRNDTITFTFPGDGNQEILIPGRKPGIMVDPKRVEANQVYPPDQRRLDTSLRVSPMAFDTRQENRKSIGADRKPEWGNVSPNQRVAIPQENRRSDYFEEHRRSPMTIEGKRMEDVRRSPMPFVPIREASVDRAGQKSPSFVNQNFEKTRQELAIWAEQRQRQEQEKNLMQNQILSTSPRSRNQSDERRDSRTMHQAEDRKDTRMTQSAFQPLPNISQSTIMEQRRHLRHVSADLTKHMELSRKEFDDQPISGSVVNLGPTASTISSQGPSPNLCHQYPALSEAKLDTKTVLTVVTDFSETNLDRPIDQVDHIIHSHRKSCNASNNLLTHSKSQTDNLQSQLDSQSEKSDSTQTQQQQLQNQRNLDLISEKLSQFERQQSDLQAKIQCLQSQNQILDKVAQFQHQQSDLQVRLQNLQAQNLLSDKLQRSNDLQQHSIGNEIHQVQSNSLPNHQEQSDKVCTSQSQHSSHGHHQTLLTASYPQNSNHQSCQSSVCEKLSPRLQHDTSDPNSIQIPNMSQMPLPCLPQFERADTSRSLFSQFHRLQCQIDGHEGASATPSGASAGSFTGTLKKVPPEKPPRTSLIVHSPDSESNRSQPAIGLKQTPKARVSHSAYDVQRDYMQRDDVQRDDTYVHMSPPPPKISRVQSGSERFEENPKPAESPAISFEDECHCFGLYVASKLKLYSNYTRCAVEHAISDILFNADVGYYERTRSLTVNTQTENAPCILFRHSEVNRPSGMNAEELSDGEGMDDHEIQSTVESILGPGVKVVDCEKKSSVREEEVLLINGVPIPLEGPDGVAIREAMITGQVPPCALLNQILVKAGILRAPVRLETSLSVKSSIVTKEEVTVARGGKVVDERSRETKENNYYASSTSEIWEPVGIVHRPRNIKPFDGSDESRPNSNASSDQGYTTNTSSNHVPREPGSSTVGCPICEDNDPDCARRCLGGLTGLGTKVPIQTTNSAPTIFGTVASDLNPKDGNSRRSLPQTPAGGVGGKGSGSAGAGSAMVNGSGAEHQDIRDGAAINTEHALVYRDGNLVSGSLEALVQHMVPTEEYYPDRAYLFAFLLSARLFIKPHELLAEVCALYEHQQNLNGEGGKERLQRFVPRLVQLLAEWTETFPYDFRDERVMGPLRTIAQKIAAVDAAARQEVSALLQNLLFRLTALEGYEEGLARLATEAATEQLTQVDITELCPSTTVLAQQLTHVELERLSYIGPEEFVQAFAKESPHLETSFKDMKKTRNLESYVQWFNRLSYFVATEVCKHAKKKQRVRVVQYWIETARECFNIGNFNSLMAIIAGLNMSPISRLKKTWAKVELAKFSILEHQMDPSSNFSSYRSTLKAAMWRSAGATDERQRIVVPFFSLLVKDLYFLNEGCSNKLPNGHINFEKFWQLAKQVTEFIAWKQVACPFEKNPRVIAFLQASPVLTENALALASFECEPPDNNPEKERYKALKSELNAQ